MQINKSLTRDNYLSPKTSNKIKSTSNRSTKVTNNDIKVEDLERIFSQIIPERDIKLIPESERILIPENKNPLTKSLEQFINFIDKHLVKKVSKLFFPKTENETEKDNFTKQISSTEFHSVEDQKLVKKLNERLHDANANITNAAREQLKVALSNAIEKKEVNYNELPDCCKPERVSEGTMRELSQAVLDYKPRESSSEKASSSESSEEISETKNNSFNKEINEKNLNEPKAQETKQERKFASELQKQHFQYIRDKHPDKLKFFEEEILDKYGDRLAQYKKEEQALLVILDGIPQLKLKTGESFTKDTTTKSQFSQYLKSVLEQNVDPEASNISSLISNPLEDAKDLSQNKEEAKKILIDDTKIIEQQTKEQKIKAKDVIKEIKLKNPDFKISEPHKMMVEIQNAITNGTTEEYIASFGSEKPVEEEESAPDEPEVKTGEAESATESKLEVKTEDTVEKTESAESVIETEEKKDEETSPAPHQTQEAEQAPHQPDNENNNNRPLD